jgi:hypothetical protein
LHIAIKKGREILKRAFVLLLAFVILDSSIDASSQTRRRRPPPKPSQRETNADAEKQADELRAGRAQIAAQIKTMTQFLYLLGGITKGIESVEQARRANEASPRALAQNEQSKLKVKESIRSVREGLTRLEASFSSTASLKPYFPYLNGMVTTGQAAEQQASANNFDEAGKSLIKVVNQLTDTLAWMR